MRRNRPKPVKKALACVERFEPSITSMVRARKPVRSASANSRSRWSPAGSGVSRLNHGRISFG